MASFPLVANEIRQPESPLDQYAKVAALRNAIQQQQLLPGQLQAQQQGLQLQQQQVQEGQLNLERTKAMNDAFQNAVTVDPQSGEATFNTAGITQHLASSGQGAAIPGVLENIEKFQQGHATLEKTQADVAQQTNDYLGSMAATIKSANYDPVVASSLLGQAAKIPAFSQRAQQLQGQIQQNPDSLKPVVDQLLAGSAKQRELGAAESTAQARQLTAKTEATKFAAQGNPQSPYYAPTPAAVALGTAPGAQQIQQNEVAQAGLKAGAEESARQSGEMALAAQKQALSQGDPNAAGQLLVNGDATLSELKSRGATPDFIARTLFAAKQLSGGKYNAQSADAQFQVAKSPANVAFFGSAKSLTDPGGTLDQLAAAAKDIPGNQVPVFNSVEDAAKAAAGSGPIAKYASILLGVSDDYSKVMGGGQGSDTSRNQALKLVPANASPEARAAAIDGIRGAVGSQLNSRIGSNPVLQRMYGNAQQPNAGGNGGSISVTAPNGKTYSFNSQADADAFKQRAGIK